MSEKETVANWMMANGFSTGHGDSVADMLNELAWQIDERVARAIDAEREACAQAAEECLTRGRSPLGRQVAEAIRARGEK